MRFHVSTETGSRRFVPDLNSGKSVMLLTRDFLKSNCTSKGGYTKYQLELIGVSWPPAKGWPKQVIGKEISEETAQKFVAAKDKEKQHV